MVAWVRGRGFYRNAPWPAVMNCVSDALCLRLIIAATLPCRILFPSSSSPSSFGTSLWFSANSAADDLFAAGASPSDIGTLTNAVQFGFILAPWVLPFPASPTVFRQADFCRVRCSALSAMPLLPDWLMAWPSPCLLRFAVGLCLAGVYPLGMKLVVSWVPERAGTAPRPAGRDADAGTAFAARHSPGRRAWPWQATIMVSSGLAPLAAPMIFGSVTVRT